MTHTLGRLLEVWLEAGHPWKPATVVSRRSLTRALRADPIALAAPDRLTPALVRAALTRWTADGAPLSVVGARFRVLRSALSWAWEERILSEHPLRWMRSPGRVPPRPLTGGTVADAIDRHLQPHDIHVHATPEPDPQ